MADGYPNITEMVMAITHDDASVVGRGATTSSSSSSRSISRLTASSGLNDDLSDAYR